MVDFVLSDKSILTVEFCVLTIQRMPGISQISYSYIKKDELTHSSMWIKLVL